MRKIHSCAKVMLVAAGIAGLIAGCSKETVHVSIQDAYVRSEFDEVSGKTIQEILEDAEIDVTPEDVVSPGLDRVVTGDTEVDIERKVKVSLLEDNGEILQIERNGGNVQQAIEQAGITLDDKSIVNVKLDHYLGDGLEIVITHQAEVTLIADGQERSMLTTCKNVDDFLEENQIVLEKLDRISSNLADEIEDGMRIQIQRVRVKKEKVKEEIPFETKTKSVASLDKGKSRVVTKGENGTKKITYKVTYVDGEEESRKKVKSENIKEPVTEVIEVGIKEQKKTPNNNSQGGKKIKSVQNFDDCDGSGHGVRVITYVDGSQKMEEY